jgi:hypothetical protein
MITGMYEMYFQRHPLWAVSTTGIFDLPERRIWYFLLCGLFDEDRPVFSCSEIKHPGLLVSAVHQGDGAGHSLGISPILPVMKLNHRSVRYLDRGKSSARPGLGRRAVISPGKQPAPSLVLSISSIVEWKLYLLRIDAKQTNILSGKLSISPEDVGQITRVSTPLSYD